MPSSILFILLSAASASRPALLRCPPASAGNLLDLLTLSHFGQPPARQPEAAEQQRQDKRRLSELVKQHAPRVIALGASHFRVNRLRKDLYDVVFDVIDKATTAELRVLPRTIPVVLRDEAVARQFELSAAAIAEFPEHPPALRRAVALGRGMRDAAAVCAALFGPEGAALSLLLHPLQDTLGRDDRLRSLEEVMVTAVSQARSKIDHRCPFTPEPATLRHRDP